MGLKFFFHSYVCCLLLLHTSVECWQPENLRVDRLSEKDAVGIDSRFPTFAWSFRIPDRSLEWDAEALPSPQDIEVFVFSGITNSTKSDEVPQTQTLLWSATLPLEASSATRIQYAGSPLPSLTKLYWKVCVRWTVCESATFVTGINDIDSWGNADWISGRQFRSPNLVVPVETVAATVAVTGLGFYELYLNGARVGDAVLDPGFSTNYSERILYAVYDITNELNSTTKKSVQNSDLREWVFGARVGAGKYSYAVNPSADIDENNVFAFRFALTLHFANHTSAVVLVSDTSWYTGESPIVWENLYNGEVYDARLAPPDNWATTAFFPQKANWYQASTTEPPGIDAAIFSARTIPPIRIVEEVEPILTKILDEKGSFFYDLGNNYAGVARVKLLANIPAGTTMTVVCTEYNTTALQPWGPADIYNQQDLYIFSGKELNEDVWAPTFVYHGFRYIRIDFNIRNNSARATNFVDTEVDGLTQFKRFDSAPEVWGLFMRSDVKQHGNISFVLDREREYRHFLPPTNEAKILQTVQHVIVQTQIDNLHSIPTDCPQREKRGWLGDAQWTAEEATLNLDMGAFYANWIRSMADVQTKGFH